MNNVDNWNLFRHSNREGKIKTIVFKNQISDSPMKWSLDRSTYLREKWSNMGSQTRIKRVRNDIMYKPKSKSFNHMIFFLSFSHFYLFWIYIFLLYYLFFHFSSYVAHPRTKFPNFFYNIIEITTEIRDEKIKLIVKFLASNSYRQ